MKITKTLLTIVELHNQTGIVQFPCYPRGQIVDVNGFRFSTKRAEKQGVIEYSYVGSSGIYTLNMNLIYKAINELNSKI